MRLLGRCIPSKRHRVVRSGTASSEFLANEPDRSLFSSESRNYLSSCSESRAIKFMKYVFRGVCCRKKRSRPVAAESAFGSLYGDESKPGFGLDSAETKVSQLLESRRRMSEYTCGPSEAIDAKAFLSKIKVPEFENDLFMLLLGALAANFVFRDTSESQRKAILSLLNQQKIRPGATVIKQGELGDTFYIVEKGSFTFRVDGTVTGYCGPGDSFGELGLLFDSRSTATVMFNGKQEGILWTLRRDHFRRLIAVTQGELKKEIFDGLRKVELLESLTDDQIRRISDEVQVCKFKPGEFVISRGETGNIFYMIKSGKAKCSFLSPLEAAIDGNDAVMLVNADESEALETEVFLERGNYFGERALLTSEPRSADIIALTNLECMALDRKSFNELLGPLQEIMSYNFTIRQLRRVPILSELQPDKLNEIESMLRQESFSFGSDIMSESENSQTKIFIIVKGTAKIKRKFLQDSQAINRTISIGSGDFFGRGSLAEADAHEVCVTVTSEQVLCRTLDWNSLKRLIRKYDLREKVTQSIESNTRLIREKLENACLKDFKVLSSLGAGDFSKVCLALNSSVGRAFVLKSIKKRHMIHHGQETNASQEIAILSESFHPFIVKFYGTFGDNELINMIFDFIQGGELYTLLRREGNAFIESDARFYAACTLEALAYLHSKNIVFRNLKPESIQINVNGYAELVDFGFAKLLNGKTYTLCGTPEYLCPEMILGKGHNLTCDSWTFGVFIFEMLTGRTPFLDFRIDSNDILFERIVRCSFKFPVSFPRKAKNLISKLIVYLPSRRIGSKKESLQDLKEHEWFADIDFEKLYAQEIKAPWVPPVENNLDSTYFGDVA